MWDGPHRNLMSLQGYELGSWLGQNQLDIPKAFPKGTTFQQGITLDSIKSEPLWFLPEYCLTLADMVFLPSASLLFIDSM